MDVFLREGTFLCPPQPLREQACRVPNESARFPVRRLFYSGFGGRISCEIVFGMVLEVFPRDAFFGGFAA